MIDLDFRVYLDDGSPIVGYGPQGPIPTEHTLDEVLAAIREGIALTHHFTGSELGAVEAIHVAIRLRGHRGKEGAEPEGQAAKEPPTLRPRRAPPQSSSLWAGPARDLPPTSTGRKRRAARS